MAINIACIIPRILGLSNNDEGLRVKRLRFASIATFYIVKTIGLN